MYVFVEKKIKLMQNFDFMVRRSNEVMSIVLYPSRSNTYHLSTTSSEKKFRAQMFKVPLA